MDTGLSAATSTIRKNFAENLRLECGKFPSIAHVCRALRINRQQFNRYLSAQYLPRPKVRRQISELFGIPENEMFSAPSARLAPIHEQIQALAEAQHLLREFALRYRGISASPVDDGFYFLYFTLKSDRRMLVRSVLKARTVNNVTQVALHTLFRSALFPARTLSKGRYVGIVVGAAEGFNLLSVGVTTPVNIALTYFRSHIDAPSGFYAGSGLVHGLPESFVSTACLQFLGLSLSSVRTKLRLAGVVSVADPSVPLYVQHAFQEVL